jgi:hypothetical protein
MIFGYIKAVLMANEKSIGRIIIALLNSRRNWRPRSSYQGIPAGEMPDCGHQPKLTRPGDVWSVVNVHHIIGMK